MGLEVIIPAVLAIASTGVAYKGQKDAAKAQEKAADKQDQMAEEQRAAAAEQERLATENAALEQEQVNEEARRLAKQQSALEGELRAKAAASGVQMSGSTFSYLQDFESEQKSQLDWLKESGASRADFIEAQGKTQAALTRAGATGTSAAAAGTRAGASRSMAGAVGSLIGGAKDQYNIWNK